MADWDLKELKALILDRYSKTEYVQASELISTLQWKFEAYEYHKGLYFEACKAEPESSLEAQRLMFGSDESSIDFHRNVSIQQFNSVAAASTIHTMPEVFAQLVAMLLLSGQLMNKHEVSIFKIRKSLSEGPIKAYFDVLSQSEYYRYLTAFVNMSKHVSMSQPSYTVHYQPELTHGLLFKSFQYKGNDFAEKTTELFIEELHGIRNDLVLAGSLFNEVLAAEPRRVEI